MLKHRLPAAVLVCALALAGCGSHHAAQSATGSVHPPGWGSTPKGPELPRPAAPQPTREMFDTVTVSTVPANPFAVAGYTAGFWQTYLPLVHAFPRAVHVPIAIRASIIITGVRMACLDDEPGDAVPSQAGPWALAELRFGVIPCIYSDLSQMPAVKASLSVLARARYFLWLAWYRFIPGLVSGYDAVQWTDKALGRNLDESTATLAFLGIHPQPLDPACFTHRMPARQCAQVKAQIARLERAAGASQRAYTVRGCTTLAQRDRFFSSQLRRYPRSPNVKRWQGALASTRTAERERACSTFSQRSGYFAGRARALQARS